MKFTLLVLAALCVVAFAQSEEDAYDDMSSDSGDDGKKKMAGSSSGSFRVSEVDDMQGREGRGKKKSAPASGSFRVSDSPQGKRKGKKGPGMSNFRVGGSEGSKKQKGGGSEKTTGASNFRVGGTADAECPVEMYQLVSAQFPKMCVDGTSKRLTLKACGEATAHNMFSVQRVGENFKLENKGECLAATSPIKGPCESNTVKVSRSGAFHVIQMNKNKCITARNAKTLSVVACGPKNKKQFFRFVPIFDAQPASNAAAGMRVGESSSRDGGKKKGKQMGGSNFRVGDDSEDDDEDRNGGKKRGKKWLKRHKKM